MAKSKVNDLTVQLEESQATIAEAVRGLAAVIEELTKQRNTGSTGEQIQTTLDSLAAIQASLAGEVKEGREEE